MSRYTAENPPQTGDIVTVDANAYYVANVSGKRHVVAESLLSAKAEYKWVVKVYEASWLDSVEQYCVYPLIDRTPSANEGYFVSPECMDLVVRLENPMGIA